MKRHRVIVWFRQDLRLHDNESLVHALKNGTEVIPIYVFDERVFKGQTRYGFKKTGKYRAQFIIECIHDLRNSLQELGSNLIVRVGKPEEEIFKIAKKAKTSWIFCNRERTQEEIDVQDALEKNSWTVGQEVIFSRGKMLYHTGDLPFPVPHCPDTFSSFRKEVERFVKIREPLETPTEKFEPLTVSIEPGQIPTIEDFGHDPIEKEDRAVLNFKGGETVALQRLKEYLWESDAISTYKQTRNQMLGRNYSSKFSPWLAQGCLSPKVIYWELKKYEAERVKNDSTYWLFFELMWRDFFRFMGKKHGNKIFQRGGTKGVQDVDLKDDMNLLQLWVEGRTGVPFIDANMRELSLTGYMSNRGRQNVASFLVKDLKVNWQMGADYFESLLIDYDPCSNWGNWNYIAGVGSDPREDRYFNILSQARRYDPQGQYVKHWLPELSYLPAEKVHRPDILSDDEQSDFSIRLGLDYPKAMVATERWA
ncbi:MAG: DASH family cryptochrome [Bacteroidota bacterium]